jgi:hypothetical protein
MWDDLTNFHKPHKYLDDIGSGYKIDKKLKKETTKAAKHLKSQKIHTGKVPKAKYDEFDFMSYFK